MEIDSSYNKKLYVENREIVYVSTNTSKREREWLEAIGIQAQSDYFTIEFDTGGADKEIGTQTVKAGKKYLNQ